MYYDKITIMLSAFLYQEHAVNFVVSHFDKVISNQLSLKQEAQLGLNRSPETPLDITGPRQNYKPFHNHYNYCGAFGLPLMRFNHKLDTFL